MTGRDWITEEEFEIAVAYLRVLLLTNVGRDRQRVQPKVLGGNPLDRGYLPASLDWRPPYLTIRNAFQLADRAPRDLDFSSASYDVDALSDLSTGTFGCLVPSVASGRGGSIFFIPVGLLGRVLCALYTEYGYTPRNGGVTEVPSWEECRRKVCIAITRMNIKDWDAPDAVLAKELGGYPLWGDYTEPRGAIKRQELAECQEKVAVLVPPLPKVFRWMKTEPKAEPEKTEPKAEPEKTEPEPTPMLELEHKAPEPETEPGTVPARKRRNLWGWALVAVELLAIVGICHIYTTQGPYSSELAVACGVASILSAIGITVLKHFDTLDE